MRHPACIDTCGTASPRLPLVPDHNYQHLYTLDLLLFRLRELYCSQNLTNIAHKPYGHFFVSSVETPLIRAINRTYITFKFNPDH